MLAGFDVSLAFVTAQAVRTQARAALLLLGLEPFCVGLALSPALGFGISLDQALLVVLLAPFLTGLVGLIGLYRAFERMEAAGGGPSRRLVGRALPLTLAWGAAFSAVGPLAFATLADQLLVLLR